jgi:hypothetical protein
LECADLVATLEAVLLRRCSRVPPPSSMPFSGVDPMTRFHTSLPVVAIIIFQQTNGLYYHKIPINTDIKQLYTERLRPNTHHNKLISFHYSIN